MTSAITNIDSVLASFDEPWAPRILATVNDWAIRLVKVRGSFVWHSHPDTDELFIVLEGELDIHLRDERGSESVVRLARHDVYVVPKRVQHCPISENGATLLLLEPADTINTGDYDAPVPHHITSTAGIPA